MYFFYYTGILIAKIVYMFVITDLQFAINLLTLFFIVEIIDFNLKKKRLHTLIAYAFVREKSLFSQWGAKRIMALCL